MSYGMSNKRKRKKTIVFYRRRKPSAMLNPTKISRYSVCQCRISQLWLKWDIAILPRQYNAIDICSIVPSNTARLPDSFHARDEHPSKTLSLIYYETHQGLHRSLHCCMMSMSMSFSLTGSTFASSYSRRPATTRLCRISCQGKGAR